MSFKEFRYYFLGFFNRFYISFNSGGSSMTSQQSCRCKCHEDDKPPYYCDKCMDNESHLPSDLREPSA